MPFDEPKSETSSKGKCHPQAQVLAGCPRGDTVCFISQRMPRSGPSDNAQSQCTVPTVTRNRDRNSPTSSRLHAGSLNSPVETQFLTSDCEESTCSSTTSRSAGPSGYSAQSIEQDSFELTASVDDIGVLTGKPTRLDVSVASGQPNLRSAFSSTVRAIIGAIFRGSGEHDLTVEATFPKCSAAVDMSQQRSSSVIAQRLPPPQPPQPLPPSPSPPPIPQIMRSKEASDKDDPIIVKAQVPCEKPSLESCTPASVQPAGPPPGIPVPSPSAAPDGTVPSDTHSQPLIYETTSVSVAPGTTAPNPEVQLTTKPQDVHEQDGVPAATSVPPSHSVAASEARTEIGPGTPPAVQQDPEISPLPVLALASSKAATQSGVASPSLVPGPAQTAVTTYLSAADSLNSEGQRADISAGVSHVGATVAPRQFLDPLFPSISVAASDQAFTTALLKSELASSEAPDFSLAIIGQPPRLTLSSAGETVTLSDGGPTIVTTLLKPDATGSLAPHLEVTQTDKAHVMQPPGTSPVVILYAPAARAVSVTTVAAPTEPIAAFDSVAGAGSAAPIGSLPPTIAPSTAPEPIITADVRRCTPSGLASPKAPEATTPGEQQNEEIAEAKSKLPSSMLVSEEPTSGRRLSENTLGGQTADHKAEVSEGDRNLSTAPATAIAPLHQGSGTSEPPTLSEGARKVSTPAEVSLTPLRQGPDSGAPSSSDTKNAPPMSPNGVAPCPALSSGTGAAQLTTSAAHKAASAPILGALPAAPHVTRHSFDGTLVGLKAEVALLPAAGISGKGTEESVTGADILKKLLDEEHTAAVKATRALQVSKPDKSLQDLNLQSPPMNALFAAPTSGHMSSGSTTAGSKGEASSLQGTKVSAKGMDESRDILKQLLEEEYAAAAKAVHAFKVSKPGESLQNNTIPTSPRNEIKAATGIESGAAIATSANVVVESADKYLAAANEMLGAVIAAPSDTLGTQENKAAIAAEKILPGARQSSASNKVTEAAGKTGKDEGEMLAAALNIPLAAIGTQGNLENQVTKKNVTSASENVTSGEVTQVDRKAVKEEGGRSALHPIPDSAITAQDNQAARAAAIILAPTHALSPTKEQTRVDENTSNVDDGILAAVQDRPHGAGATDSQPGEVAGRGRAATLDDQTTKEPGVDQMADTIGRSAPAASYMAGEVLDVAHAKPTTVAVPEVHEGIVALPQSAQNTPVVGGVFAGIDAMTAGTPGEGQQHNVRDSHPGGVFPSASSRCPGVAPSAVAPTPAAPSAVVRMPRQFGSVSPRRGWPGMVTGGRVQPPLLAPSPRMLTHTIPYEGSPVPPMAAQCAEIEWARVAAPAKPVFAASCSNVIRRRPMEKETLQAGGEGAPQQLLMKEGIFNVEEAKPEAVKFFGGVENSEELRNSALQVGFKKIMPGELTQATLETGSAQGLSTPRPFLTSVMKKLKGKIRTVVKQRKFVSTPREAKLKFPLESSSKSSTLDISTYAFKGVVPHASEINTAQRRIRAGEINKTVGPGIAKGSEAANTSAQKLSSHCGNLESQSQESSEQLKCTTEDRHEMAVTTAPHGRNGGPKLARPQSPEVSIAQSAVLSVSSVAENCTTSAAKDLNQTLSAECSANEASRSTTACESQYAGVQCGHYSNGGFGVSIRRLVTAPVNSLPKESCFSTAESCLAVRSTPFPGMTEQSRSNNSASCLGSPIQTAGAQKRGEGSKEEQSKKADISEVVAPETDTHDEVPKTEARTLDGIDTRLNREYRDVRAAVVLEDEEPSCALLACTLVLVVAILMSLLNLIYALTAAVPPPGTTQPAPSVFHAPDVIYCSSEFCDREADYLGSLLGTSGKNACENFYEHVCGAWSQAHPLRALASAGNAISADTIIQDKWDKELTSLLRANTAQDVDMAVALYDACVDRNKAAVAANDVKELFKAWTIQTWPQDMNSSVNEVWEFAGELVRDLGLGAIVDVAVIIGAKGDGGTVLELRQPAHVLSCNDAWRLPVSKLFRNALSDLSLEFAHAPGAEIMDEVMAAFLRLGSCFANRTVGDFSGLKFGGAMAAEAELAELNDDVRQFLATAFENVSAIVPATVVLLKPENYVRQFLAAALRELPPRALMNYMGLLALVHLSPFLPERHVHLRQLFAKMLRGRTLPDVSNSSALCLMAAERALPACFSKLSASVFRAAEYDVRVPEKLSQLEDLFARNVQRLAWMSDELALVNRYRLKRRRASLFGSTAGANTSCAPSGVARRTDSPVEFYRDVFQAQQRARLEPITAGRGRDTLRVASVRPSSVHAEYDRLLRQVLVPAALFNTSVPGNSAGFSLQLARYAVRFYRALLEALLMDDWDSGRDEAVRRKMQALLQCFEWDLRELPAVLRGAVTPDPAWSRAPLLQQTAALQLAFRAFRELWQVRRAWNADFRYRRLPSLSADALFFVYYALDNCETSDSVYKGSQPLPAEHRVNLPLSHLTDFAALFNCPADAAMARIGHSCAVVTPDRWSIRVPADA